MEMNPGALPRPGRVPAQEFWSPETWWRWRRRSELLLEKRVLESGFSRREYICEGGQPEAEREPQAPPWAARGGAAPGGRLGRPWLPSGPTLVFLEASCTLIFSVFSPEFLEHFSYGGNLK